MLCFFVVLYMLRVSTTPLEDGGHFLPKRGGVQSTRLLGDYSAADCSGTAIGLSRAASNVWANVWERTTPLWRLP